MPYKDSSKCHKLTRKKKAIKKLQKDTVCTTRKVQPFSESCWSGFCHAASLSPLTPGSTAASPRDRCHLVEWKCRKGLSTWKVLEKTEKDSSLKKPIFPASSLRTSTWAMPLTEPADRDMPALCRSHQEPPATWTVREHFESFQVEWLMVFLLLIPCITRRAPKLSGSLLPFHPFFCSSRAFKMKFPKTASSCLLEKWYFILPLWDNSAIPLTQYTPKGSSYLENLAFPEYHLLTCWLLRPGWLNRELLIAQRPTNGISLTQKNSGVKLPSKTKIITFSLGFCWKQKCF